MSDHVRFEYSCDLKSKRRSVDESSSSHLLSPRAKYARTRGSSTPFRDREALEEEESATWAEPGRRPNPSRKVYAHPSLTHIDQMSKWIREETVGPIFFDQDGVDPSTMQLASWRRIVSQAGAIESMPNSERRKIWKYMRDPKNDISARHLFLSCGMTAGQICCLYEISKSVFSMPISKTVEIASRMESAKLGHPAVV